MRPIHNISAGPVHEHLQLLTTSGLTLAEIGRRAGLSRQTVDYVRTHPTVSPRVAGSILGVHGLTPFGTRRRIAALQVIGWTTRQIDANAGVYHGAAAAIMTGHVRATGRVWSGIALAYDAMWQGPANPCRETVRRSLRLGYAPPMAWDDDTIDDPRATPQGMYPQPVSVDELVEDLLDMADAGRSWDEAARRCGYLSPLSLARRLRRVGHLAEVQTAFQGERRDWSRSA